MLTGFKGYGQSPENGAKPLVYACCAPEDDLRGKRLGQRQFQIISSNSV